MQPMQLNEIIISAFNGLGIFNLLTLAVYLCFPKKIVL